MSFKLLPASIICASAILFGCAAPVMKSVNLGSTPTQIKLTYDSGDTGISQAQVFSNISSTITSAAGYKAKGYYRNASGISDIKGMEVKSRCMTESQCMIGLLFQNGERYSSTNNEYVTVQEIAIPVTFSQADGKIVALIDINYSVNTLEARNPVFIPYSPLLDNAALTRVFKNIEKIQPEISFSKSFAEELTIDSQDNVVYGNFKRVYGFYKYNEDESKDKIGKESTFSLTTKQGSVPLTAEIYPSREGALLNYNFTMKYSAKPDGTTNYNPQDIAPIKASIKNVASM
ncbi:hypothetical protein [Thalassolituus sp. UBA2009]|uniref:hypothetical protein n=1 Tax=Thalassolituus sp. UBA2009 TaxID=1947658 RepID=UPI00257B53F9|nr:hypothetical protein [Thalassolituus sp. UBA2009]